MTGGALVEATCQHCGRAFRARRRNVAAGYGRHCSRACGSAKLTVADAAAIRERYQRYAAGRTRQVALAALFRVSQSTISLVVRGRRHGAG